MELGFPHARTIVHVGRLAGPRQKAAEWENAYYVSSRPATSMSPERWLQTIRDHWGGCEIRNHWRKDACLFEDKTRSRNPTLVANLMLLRNLALLFYAQHGAAYKSLPAFVEDVVANAHLALALIWAPS